MNRRLITPPEPAPPTVYDIIDALESARELLGSCGQLAKGHAADSAELAQGRCVVIATHAEVGDTLYLAECAECGCHRWVSSSAAVDRWMHCHYCGGCNS